MQNKMVRFFILIPLVFALGSILSACGVKGPPLPPVSATPQRSEEKSEVRPEPSPFPSGVKKK